MGSSQPIWPSMQSRTTGSLLADSPRSGHIVMDLGLTTEPNMHRAQKWPIQGADRSRAIVGGAARISGNIGRDANQSMFSGPQTRNTLESKSEVEMRNTILLGYCWIPQTET